MQKCILQSFPHEIEIDNAGSKDMNFPMYGLMLQNLCTLFVCGEGTPHLFSVTVRRAWNAIQVGQ